MERIQRQIELAKARFTNQPVLGSALLGSITVLLSWAVQDYKQFKSLGRGGVPYNVFGWLIVSLLLRPLSLRKQDATKTNDYEFGNGIVGSEVRDLPTRSGERAVVGGIVPQRQLSQNAPESMRKVGLSREISLSIQYD